MTATSRRQTCVSHSTPEAEYAAGDHAIRVEGLPQLTLWEYIPGRTPSLVLAEDNEAVIKIVTSGKTLRFGHVSRTRR
eukprot:6349780-Prorocentrum_lima.AAC.1